MDEMVLTRCAMSSGKIGISYVLCRMNNVWTTKSGQCQEQAPRRMEVVGKEERKGAPGFEGSGATTGEVARRRRRKLVDKNKCGRGQPLGPIHDASLQNANTHVTQITHTNIASAASRRVTRLFLMNRARKPSHVTVATGTPHLLYSHYKYSSNNYHRTPAPIVSIPLVANAVCLCTARKDPIIVGMAWKASLSARSIRKDVLMINKDQ
ncbi:hypothetical protein DENSPDRAFT_245809 [Dentipellis sp. KUC8613]|nr:hypothetical protein DENSPDRAFT_245809 [Dentipellis sp. KUC8613]